MIRTNKAKALCLECVCLRTWTTLRVTTITSLCRGKSCSTLGSNLSLVRGVCFATTLRRTDKDTKLKTNVEDRMDFHLPRPRSSPVDGASSPLPNVGCNGRGLVRFSPNVGHFLVASFSPIFADIECFFNFTLVLEKDVLSGKE